MKITIKDIIDLILLSKTPSIDSGENRNQIAEINRDLTENGLEIEGYERSGWTKFDSCKGATYPPKEKFLAWGLPDPDCDGTPTEFFCWRDDGGFSCNESAYPEIHFWRPLPKPPVETEVKDEA